MKRSEKIATVDQPPGVWPPMIVLARWLLSIFFRRVEVVGREHLPSNGPVMYVANHNNSLVDAALLVGFLKPTARFLGKSTLWKVLILKPFLELTRSIPVYRRQDPGVDASKNSETFARCHEALAEGGAIAIFPEGTSHSEPALVPLKTGVSRIVLEAEEKFPGIGVQIIPVGLTFEAKDRFRSRALVNVGQAIDPALELEQYARQPREAVRALTRRVKEALEGVTLNFPSWDEARLIERAAEIYERPHTELPAEQPLSQAFSLRQRFVEGYAELHQRCPEEVEKLAAAVRTYDGHLEELRLKDEQVAAEYSTSGVLRFTLKSLVLLLLRLPLAILGTAIHFVPFFGASWAARRQGSEDILATYKILASVVFYPLTWLFLAAWVGWWFGGWAALALLLLAPVSGITALRYFERRGHFLRQARAYFVLRSGRRRIEDLRLLRREVLQGVRRLVDVVQGAS